MTDPSPARPIFGLRHLEQRLPTLLRRLQPTGVWVVLDRGAEPVLGKALHAGLERSGLPYRVFAFTPSEKRKTMAQVESFASRMIRAGADRQGLVLGVGGGITTDLAGFTAATLMRGCRWGAIPTTLLGMADAAIGGKTAINLPEGKNLVGSFHQPSFVLADTVCLRTLPAREWGCGLGEVIKSGMIASPSLLKRLEETPKAALRRAGDASLAFARGAAQVKSKIVAEDPKEGGTRKLLNLGHTFGHALETAAGPRKLAHGEAVGLGLLCALDYAVSEGRARDEYAGRIEALLRRCSMPTSYPGRLPSVGELTRLIARDKKKAGATVDVILPIRPGKCEIVPGCAPRDLAIGIHRRLG